MKLVKRIKSPTPKGDKDLGRLLTLIAVGCASVLGIEVDLDLVYEVVLLIASCVSGIGALYHAQKVDYSRIPK